MPTFLSARPAGDPVEETKIRQLAGARHAPADWVLRARGIQIQRSQVRRILLKEKVRWRHTRSWIASTDPEFTPKGPRSSASTPSRQRAPRSSAPTSSAR